MQSMTRSRSTRCATTLSTADVADVMTNDLEEGETGTYPVRR
jgi:hypothetical protein